MAEGTREDVDDTVEILTPVNNTKVSGALQIIVRTSACFCDEKTKLYANDIFCSEGHCFDSPGTDQLFVHYWNSGLRDDGEYELKVMGKHNESYDTITVSVDKTGGQNDFTSDILLYPFNNTKVSGTVTITDYSQVCNCTDRPTIYVDDKEEATLDSNDWVVFCGLNYEQFQYDLDTTELTNGEHTVRVDDKHAGFGNEITLVVDNQGGGPEPDDDDDDHTDDDDDHTDDNDDHTDDDEHDDDDEDDGDKEGILNGPYKHPILASIALVLAAILIILIILNLKLKKKKEKEQQDEPKD
jgi:hypothetical protein